MPRFLRHVFFYKVVFIVKIREFLRSLESNDKNFLIVGLGSLFVAQSCIVISLLLNRPLRAWHLISMIILTLVYWNLIWLKYREFRRRIFFTELISESKTTYFCGFPLSSFLASNAFIRIEDWARTGLCYELSAIAMLLLKFNPTTRMCRGFFERNGHLSRHSWVEFKIPFNGWFVMDLAWLHPSIVRKKLYQEITKISLTKRWTCDYAEFWSLDLANILYDYLRDPKTSNVLMDLWCFGNPDQSFEFYQVCFQKNLTFSDGGKGMSLYYVKESKPLSTQIVQDFVRRPSRRQPRSKTVRWMRSELKKYNLKGRP